MWFKVSFRVDVRRGGKIRASGSGTWSGTLKLCKQGHRTLSAVCSGQAVGFGVVLGIEASRKVAALGFRCSA